MAVAAPSVTPYMNVWIPYLENVGAYYEGSVANADQSSAVLYLDCPEDQDCPFSTAFRMVTGTSTVAWSASSGGIWTWVECGGVGYSTATCTSSFSSSDYITVTQEVVTSTVANMVYITDGASLLGYNSATPSATSLLPFAQTVAPGATATSSFATSARTSGTQSGSATGSSGKPAGTAASGSAGTGSGSGSGGVINAAASSVKAGVSASASAAASAGAKAFSNAAPARPVNNAIFGIGGLLAAMTVAVAAM